MIKMKKIYQSSLLILMVAALLFSCKKDISEIGVNVVGDNPLEVIYVDTFSVTAYSEMIDSMSTISLSSNMLGAIKDPVFGTTNTSVYAQFRLEANNVSYEFEEGAVLDKVVLYLAYADDYVYGDKNYTQHLSVYEVGDQMIDTVRYYHFDNLRIKDELLGDTAFVPNFDSVEYHEIVDNDTIESGMKIAPIEISLSNELGERLMNYDSEVYASNESFLQEFAGIYITTLDQNLPSNMGGIFNIDLTADDSKITLYYHYPDEDNPGEFIEEEFDLICNSSSVRFGNYNHYDYADASPEFYNHVVLGDTNAGSEQFYLQSLAGVRSYIRFPNLGKLDNYENYAVNEAKLILHEVSTDDASLEAIESFSLTQQVMLADSSIGYYTVPDVSLGTNYFGGEYDSLNSQYFFRITQFVQDVISGESYDNQLRMELIGGAVNANRSIIGGFNPMNETQKLEFKVTYTQIEFDD
jgi:hypothetical protein